MNALLKKNCYQMIVWMDKWTKELMNEWINIWMNFIPIKVAIAEGKNEVLLMIIMTVAATASTAATSGLDRKLMKGLQTVTRLTKNSYN